MNISTIGVIGHGRFGSFFSDLVLPMVFPKAKIFISSRTSKDKRVVNFDIVANSDLIIPAVPIRKMPNVLKKLSRNISKSSIVMEVCSVNKLPVEWMKEILPKFTPLISSHPLFGRSSYEKVRGDLSKLTMVMYPVRINNTQYTFIRDAFSKVVNIVRMSPDSHDKKAAKFQFLSHLIGGVLHRLDLNRSEIDTESASRMFDMIEVLNSDSLVLFEDIYKYNPYAKDELQKFDKVYKKITSKLLI